MRARTPEGIAEAVQTLLRAPPRREATRAFAERFSWDDTSAGQLRLFERILAASGDSVPAVSR
jgi:teichuronic acid biosynthesis glycosyltransferase TuaC